MLAFKGRSIFAITLAFVGYAIGFGDRGSIGMLTPAVFNKSRNSVGGFKFGPSSDFAFSIMDTRGSRQSQRSQCIVDMDFIVAFAHIAEACACIDPVITV